MPIDLLNVRHWAFNLYPYSNFSTSLKLLNFFPPKFSVLSNYFNEQTKKMCIKQLDEKPSLWCWKCAWVQIPSISLARGSLKETLNIDVWTLSEYRDTSSKAAPTRSMTVIKLSVFGLILHLAITWTIHHAPDTILTCKRAQWGPFNVASYYE